MKPARPLEPRSLLVGVKPGWYVLAALLVYAAAATALLLTRPASGVAAQDQPVAAASAPAAHDLETKYGPTGLWFPVPGARLPSSDDNLPGAPRAYRHGVSQGFDFYGQDAQVPILNGTPVVAAQAGQIVRADVAYTETDPRAWEVLMADVGDAGATEEQLDRLRGRQVWLRLEDGTVLRYGHLSAIQGGIRTGVSVYRGQVIGFAGNSGTDVAVAGGSGQPRLRFEVWTSPDTFFGSGMEPDAVRMAAVSLFVGP